MPTVVQSAALFVGRFLLSFIFVTSGIMKITGFAGTAEAMSNKGMPVAWFFLIGAIVFELAGGLSVIAGYWTRLGAMLLLIFLLPTTLIFHDFWTIDDPQQRMLESSAFFKNVAIFGGLLVLWGAGPGGFSLDARRRRNSAAGY